MLVQGIILSLFLAAGARAAAPEPIADNTDLPSACRGDTVRTVAIQTEAGLFQYRYAYRPADDPDMPVVILIPGGPGQGSIGMPTSVPYQFGIVRTDPRGAGCNENAALSADDVDSETLASDVLAVVRDLGPKRYILFGASYGTVVATIAASKAAQAGVPPPDAVVLEAVMGRAYHPDESLKNYLDGWEKLKRRLPEPALRVLSQDPPPLGFSPEIWGGWIGQLLLYGVNPSGDDFAAELLSSLDPAAPAAGRERLALLMTQFALPTPAGHVNLYRSIVCREIDPTTRGQLTDVALRGGDLVPIDPGFCSGRPLSHPFDALDYPVSAPIFYFSGGQDPATPEAQTFYHYLSQPSARKTWVRVPSGGHLSFTMNLEDCYEPLWTDIAERGGANLEALLNGCSIRPVPYVMQPPR